MSDRRQNTAGTVTFLIRDIRIEVELLPDGALITASMENGEEKKMLLSESEKEKESSCQCSER